MVKSRKKFVRNLPQWDFIVLAKVKKIVEQKEFCNKTKTVFDCEILPAGEARIVYWNRLSLNAGDEIYVKGFKKEKVLLAVEIAITKRVKVL